MADKPFHRLASISDTGCWEWTGAKGKLNGYGYVNMRGKGKEYAHRVAYELENGPIPEGLLVCHHCDNRLCVNPDHLFLGTYRDNFLDCIRKGRRFRTHCKNGHEMTPENTTSIPSRPSVRHCLSCRHDSYVRCYRRKRQRELLTLDNQAKVTA